jgi:gamma-tubulin complex component 5
MCLQFSEFFVTIAGDAITTHDTSRQSLSVIQRQHRSRRQRATKRNVIGFSQSLAPEESDPSSDEDDEEESLGPPDASTSISFSVDEDEDVFIRLERMSIELNGLVRFVRRGVETLAGGVSEAAPTFGVLAFALEDWDT